MSDLKKILESHGNPQLRKFITSANKKIRSKISEEIKEERGKFSAEIKAKRLTQKLNRVIAIPKGADRAKIINLMLKHGQHFGDLVEGKKLHNMTAEEAKKIKRLRNPADKKARKVEKAAKTAPIIVVKPAPPVVAKPAPKVVAKPAPIIEKPKKEPTEDKEKEIDNLLKQIKKSYEKNKPKIDKLTEKKYKDFFNKKLNELYEDVEDIFQKDLTNEKRFDLRKRFSNIIPRVVAKPAPIIVVKPAPPVVVKPGENFKQYADDLIKKLNPKKSIAEMFKDKKQREQVKSIMISFVLTSSAEDGLGNPNLNFKRGSKQYQWADWDDMPERQGSGLNMSKEQNREGILKEMKEEGGKLLVIVVKDDTRDVKNKNPNYKLIPIK
tara:strand:+ start:185 stop:1327 length:1143 start_codon:yes stop_codon:yes gene_type:complete